MVMGSVESRSISFSWEPPSDTNFTIIGYSVICNNSMPAGQDTLSERITISRLEPFTNYGCFVFAQVKGNRGNDTETITTRTAEEGMKGYMYYESVKFLTLHYKVLKLGYIIITCSICCMLTPYNLKQLKANDTTDLKVSIYSIATYSQGCSLCERRVLM